MFSDRHRDDAVLLDEIWDGIVASNPAVTSPQQLLEAIRDLEAGAPMMSTSQRERIRAKVQFPSTALRTGVSTTAITVNSAPIRVATPIARRRHLDHPILQIAATILLLLGIAGAWFVTRYDDSTPETTPVGAITSPASQEQPPLDPLLYISVPAADAARNLTVIVRRIEIAPGGNWSATIDEANQNDSDAALALTSGAINAEGTDGSSTAYDRPGRIDLPSDGRLEITNMGDNSAFLVEFTMSPNGAGAEAVSPDDRVTINSSEPPAPLFVPTGFPATLYLWNSVGSTISEFVTPPGMALIYGVVDHGSYTYANFGVQPENLASPVADGSIPIPYAFGPGSVFSSIPGDFPSLGAVSDDASIFLVSARQFTNEDVARIGTSSEVSFSNEQIQLDLRLVTIQPGGRYAFSLTGSVITWGISGSGSIASGLSGDAAAIVPNLYTKVFGSSEFSITAQGDQPAVFFLALVSEDPIEVTDSSQTTMTVAATDPISLPLESHYLHFSLDASAGIEVNPSSQETALTLVSAGDVELTALTELNLHTSEGTTTLAPFAGPITLSPGDWFITEPGDGYRLSRSDAESQIARITLSPIVPPGSVTQTQATPEGESPETVACVITPRPLDTYEQFLATPYAEGDPVVNHRDDTESVAANPAIAAGVTETMHQLLACNRLDTLYQRFSLYSAARIRYQASIGNLDLQKLEESSLTSSTPVGDQGPVPDQLVIDQVSTFPDGRAGAWVSAGAEIAYVTFVFEDGQWLIDYWDDSSDSATPIP